MEVEQTLPANTTDDELYSRVTSSSKIIGKVAPYESTEKSSIVINTPEKFAPTLAEIAKWGELGKESWWEVVYHDGINWQHFAGSNTFEDGEKVIKWKLCRECL